MKNFFSWLKEMDQKKNAPSAGVKKDKDFIKYRSLWQESSGLDIPNAPDTQQEWQKLQRSIRNLDESRNWFAWFSWKNLFAPRIAIAYSFIGVLCTAFIIYQLMQPTVYSTTAKEQKNITLEDGSLVHMNAGSQLSVAWDFNSATRDVTLDGEAYFEVTKNNKSFTVNTASGTVHVVGTAFNVKTRNDKMVVAVNEGIVRVTATTAPRDSTRTLVRGQMITCRNGAFPSALNEVSIDSSPDWMYAKMDLDDETLIHVFQEIERRFNIKINCEEEALKDVKISGAFDTSDLDSLMSALCILIKKDFKKENNIIYIYGSKS